MMQESEPGEKRKDFQQRKERRRQTIDYSSNKTIHFHNMLRSVCHPHGDVHMLQANANANTSLVEVLIFEKDFSYSRRDLTNLSVNISEIPVTHDAD
jgi:hypothetical protein